MKRKRTRTKRRAEQRAAVREVFAIRRELLGGDLGDRIAAINRAVAPDSAIFWHTMKGLIGAREWLRPITDLDTVRGFALRILGVHGFDLTGIVLKVNWSPPVLAFEAQADQALAVQAVEGLRARRQAATGR